MATVDLRTLPISEQHHPLAFNELGATGRRATDYLWICPECDDGITHAPMTWSGGEGYVHLAHRATEFEDAVLHRLVAVDVIAVLEQYRQIAVHDDGRFAHMAALGAPKESAHA